METSSRALPGSASPEMVQAGCQDPVKNPSGAADRTGFSGQRSVISCLILLLSILVTDY